MMITIITLKKRWSVLYYIVIVSNWSYY